MTASPSSQPSLEPLAGRRFSFYPAIRNIEHNEWTLARETWSEILVANESEKLEIWVPRKYVTGISSSDSPVLIVGLDRELRLHAGAVWPHREKVVAMPDRRSRPRPEPDGDLPPPPAASAATPASESSISRLIGVTVVLGLVVCALIMLFVFRGIPNPVEILFRPDTTTSDQRYLGLTGADRYHDVLLKLGNTDNQQWLTPEDAQIHFQLIGYPGRSYVVVLMGGVREDARYIGTLHARSRKILDTVKLSGGGTTASMLNNMPDF